MKTLSYKIKHDYDTSGFLCSYKHLLQEAIDIIWDNISWVEKEQRKHYYVRKPIPIIPMPRDFKRNLRNVLLKDWDYAKHYVDSERGKGYNTSSLMIPKALIGVRLRMPMSNYQS
ncbi:MAG: hypothetical protein F7B61_06805 [Caldisphaeraceae archaeon]|nr:hypothetical protein [Caldisphaeraceae archaeon]